MPGRKFHTDKTGFADYCINDKHHRTILTNPTRSWEITWRKIEFLQFIFSMAEHKTKSPKNNFETISIRFLTVMKM